MRNTFIYFVLLLQTSCSPNGFIKLSKEIDSKQHSEKIFNQSSFHDVRVKLYKNEQDKFRLWDFKNDTLFILETYSLEDGKFYGKIWNKSNSLNYSYQNGKFVFESTHIFTKYMSSLIQKWDTVNVRLEESMYSKMNPSRTIYATRVINNKTINTINFNQFFKMGRDNFN